jgi:hypothetical protein
MTHKSGCKKMKNWFKYTQRERGNIFKMLPSNGQQAVRFVSQVLLPLIVAMTAESKTEFISKSGSDINQE